MSKRGIGIWIIMLCSLVFLIGCSTYNFLNGMKFWDESITYGRIANKDVKHFVSSVRPPLGNPHSHYLLATYYQERGMHKEAIEEFKKIISIDPLHIKAYNGIGVSFDKLGHTYRAIEYYKKALSLNPDLGYVLNNLGFAYVRIEKYEKAINALEKALRLNDDKRFHNNLGLAYAREGLFEEAFNEFNQGGNEVNAHYNMGQIYYEKGLYQEAKTHFVKALNADPSFVSARSWIDLVDSIAATNQSSDVAYESKKKTDVTTGHPLTDEKSYMVETINSQTDDKIKERHITKDNKSYKRIGLVVKSTNSQTADEIKERHITKDKKSYKKIGLVVKSENSQTADEIIERQDTKDTASYEKIGLEISNGNGVNGMARRLGGFLSEKGFDLVRLTNADNFNHAETIVYYRDGHLNAASELAKHMPISFDMHKVRKFDQSNIDIKVLIGKDIVKYDNAF